VRRFNIKNLTLRLAALGFGFFLSAYLHKESEPLKSPSDSFLFVSNPSQRMNGDFIKEQIDQASDSLDIQIYALTDKKLIKLLNKKSQSLPISIYYDPQASPKLSEKLHPPICLKPYTKRGLMHRKICVIDQKTALFGSSNYTSSSLFWHYNSLCSVQSESLCQFLQEKKRGAHLFEYGIAFLLPDIKNQALSAVISKINQANQSIDLAMFSLTHPKIMDALIESCKKNVKIHLYLDRINLKNISAKLHELKEAGAHIYTQKEPVLLHHKTCLIDKKILIIGSTNWSHSGFKKNEEVLVIFDKLDENMLQAPQDMFLKLQEDLEVYKDCLGAA
jgi:phosphatidylserine/phosphatidylglycerophosphate/cardiolipin synthase-like enzyme